MLSAEDNLARGAAFVHDLELQRARSLRLATWLYSAVALAATLWLAFTLFRIQSANKQLLETEGRVTAITRELQIRQDSLALSKREATHLETQLARQRVDAELLDAQLKAKQQALDEVENALKKYDQGEKTSVGKAVSDIVKLGATENGYSLWQRGYAAYNAGQRAKAEELYLQSIAAAPKYAPPYNSLGRLCYERKDVDCAERWYRQAYELRRDYAPTLHNLALIAVTHSQYAEACAWTAQALRARPDYDLPRRLARELASKGHACPL